MSENKVTVTVGGTEYRLITDESPELIQRCADYYNAQLLHAQKEGATTALTASVLAGLTMSKDYLQFRISAEKLTAQMRTLMEENERQRGEIERLKQASGQLSGRTADK